MKRSKIKPLSSRRASEMKLYREAREIYMNAHDMCERCNSYQAKEIHHRFGRSGAKLYDPTGFVALCSSCHQTLHANPNLARQEGWSGDRLKVID